MKKYQIIYKDLEKAIHEQKYQVGDFLPTEQELVQSYQVSRDTIRKALTLLVEEGLVKKIHGSGSQVINQEQINFPVSDLTSYQELIEQQGLNSQTNVISLDKIIVDSKLSERTGFSNSRQVWRVVRQRVVDIVVAMVLTFLFHKTGFLTKTEEDGHAQEALKEASEGLVRPTVLAESAEVVSPLAGQVKPLSQATDPVFSSGVMGQGVVIEPSQGELVSPVNGTVTVLFPTKHAVGIVSEEGVEMLMHIGMDTVSLDGKGFEAHVEQGDKVVVGQQLISFDMDVIKKAGLVTETPVIITNQDDFQADVEGNLPRDINRGDDLMTATRTK